jgi:hypothetical protein
MAKLPRFFFYVDEFQSMMNEAFADILSEARKYKLALTLANQYIEQMEEKVREAVFGNVGTLIVFRVGPFDAEVLKTVFEPTFTAEDLVELGLGQIYLTLMIDGVGSPPFSAQTIPPIDRPTISYKNDVIESSRGLYARTRADIEKIVIARQQEFAMPPPKPKGDFGPGKDKRRSPFSVGPSMSNSQMQNRPPMSAQANWQQSPIQPQQLQPVGMQSAPRSNDTSGQNSGLSGLRAAIQAAKTTSAPPSGRSPLDVLREKQSLRQTREGTLIPKNNAPPSPLGAMPARASAPLPPTVQPVRPVQMHQASASQPQHNQNQSSPSTLHHQRQQNQHNQHQTRQQSHQQQEQRWQKPQHEQIPQNDPRPSQKEKLSVDSSDEISPELLRSVIGGNDGPLE